MILDAQQKFSDAQALTASAASTNSIDLIAARDLFAGEDLVVLISVDVAADVADANETYAFALQTDDNSGFSSPTTLASRTIAGAELTAGSKHTIPVPAEADVEQYIRLSYTLGGTTPSITVTAFLAPRSFVEQRRDYPSGFSVA
jgi:hypothetical protein